MKTLKAKFRKTEISPDFHPGPTQCLEPDNSTPPSPTPRTQHSFPDNLAEDEEVFEEIRRLRLERGHLLQKIKALEQQQNSTTNALEELNSLRERLGEAEAERDCLEVLLKDLGGVRLSGTTTDDMLDFPGTNRLLSKQSQSTEGEMPPAQPENSSWGTNNVEQLCRQVEELTAQNAELVLKVQMLEMFEKDDTDSGLDFVPMSVYDSLKREFEKLQQRYTEATKNSSTAEEPMSEDNSEDISEGKSKKAEGSARETAEQEENRKSLEQQLACAHAELEELKKQMGIDSVTTDLAVSQFRAEDKELSADLQSLTARVQELEAALAEKEKALKERLNESDTIEELKQKVQKLEESLQVKEKEAQAMSESAEKLKEQIQELENALEKGTVASCLAEGKEESLNKLRMRVTELETELSKSVPREQLDEVQVSMGLQLDQLARERSDIALRLNQALLDLERLCPPSHTDKDDSGDDDNTEEPPKSYKSSSALESHVGRTLAAVLEELEEISQPDTEELDDLCAGTEDCSNVALKMTDVVPQAQHQEALSAALQQLAETENKLQAERALCEQAHAELARLKHDLQEAQHGMISKDKHEKIRAELQHTLEESQNALAAAQEALSGKELELKELQSQKAVELDMVSKEDHEAQRVSLQAEINTLTACLADLNRKHEKTCTEVFQVQREALFNKSERQAAEAQLLTVQQQLADLQAQSSHIQQLHQDIQHSKGIIKEKDHKITEMSKDVFRLKEALGALTPPMGLKVSTTSSGNPGQQLALQNRISALTQQLQDFEQKHKTVVATYRSHLLAAVQGRMDEEVQALLVQILRMTQNNQRH
ncbi:Ankyrin repeat domain-containing protein 24 [Bagarius yarrelli]|uniref:Ankyrin repeat domain-containing protein 24 n=1 Tax=Bagarius yarrelli TaxID=175774 RepID=A0A556U312_BAGYA|nr:Ankyrin repeat domain-containing protein 24 [Bagarius yarrelli]